ncbi:MAG: LamG domain-containing protein, partial [Patescibacteria group bacterium]|nr:LamG domain-containing protein [Patescibacteria group bacterium]
SYEVLSLLESEKYLKSSASKDKGSDPGRLELGTDLSLWKTPSGAVAHWAFEEGSGSQVKDDSGRSNNITWYGTGVHYAIGKVGAYAGQFNGTDDHAEALPVSDFDFRNQSFSITAWVKPGDPLGGRFLNEYASLTLDGAGAWVSASGGGPGVAWTSCGGLNTATWTHVAFVFDNSVPKITLYKNGEFCVDNTGSGTMDRYYSSIWLGSGAADWNQIYKGLIDDVYVYRRNLNATEMKALYKSSR